MAKVLDRASSRTVANAESITNAAPKRSGNAWLTAVTVGATLAVGFTFIVLPPVAAFVTHMIERVSNHIKAKKELNVRAEWYRDEIATTLNMNPAKVKGKHLVQAARINSTLEAAVRDVNREESKENKSSAVINTIVGFIPAAVLAKEVGGAVKAATFGAKAMVQATQMGKILAATTAGGLLSSWTDKEHLSAQEVIEGISTQLAACKEQGIDPKTKVTPQMVFMLRIAQDEKLGNEIKATFKKPFNKMNENEQNNVMQAYSALANATTSEAYAVANSILPVQELMARAPNLDGTARYAIGNGASTFTERLMSGRTNGAPIMRGNAANDGFAAAEDARRATPQGPQALQA